MADSEDATTHVLKLWPEFYEPLISGKKTFEIRRNDRGFRVGDQLHLREWDPASESYTGRSCWRVVTYITDARSTGALNKGFVCMSVAALTE